LRDALALQTTIHGSRARKTRGLYAANFVASALPVHERAMPFLADLEELRKRATFSILGILIRVLLCWSFADRLFGLMQHS
jgi:hypothetical protein